MICRRECQIEVIDNDNLGWAAGNAGRGDSAGITGERRQGLCTIFKLNNDDYRFFTMYAV